MKYSKVRFRNLVIELWNEIAIISEDRKDYNDYSVPHEESRKMFLFIVHFASFLQNQLSYGHVLCTTMIPYLP